MKIGFIGLGIMGSRMAANLLKHSYDLIVFNRTKSKTEKLIKAGAEYTDDLTYLSKKSSIIFTMLSTPKVIEQIAFSEKGFVNSMKNNSIWIDCSTVNPGFSKIIAKKCHEKGIRFLDAPVAGSLKPAEKGELTFLVGGDLNVLEEIRPLLEVMGKKIIYAGENGKGSALKMIVNMLMGISMAAFTEAINLGTHLGFDQEKILDILLDLPVVAPILKPKKNKFLTQDFSPEFPLKWMQKDLHLASLTAYEQDISMPILNTVKEIFALAKQLGFSDEDFSAVYKVFNK